MDPWLDTLYQRLYTTHPSQENEKHLLPFSSWVKHASLHSPIQFTNPFIFLWNNFFNNPIIFNNTKCLHRIVVRLSTLESRDHLCRFLTIRNKERIHCKSSVYPYRIIHLCSYLTLDTDREHSFLTTTIYKISSSPTIPTLPTLKYKKEYQRLHCNKLRSQRTPWAL